MTGKKIVIMVTVNGISLILYSDNKMDCHFYIVTNKTIRLQPRILLLTTYKMMTLIYAFSDNF